MKKLRFIASLIILPMAMGLSSCNSSPGNYSPYRPSRSDSTSDYNPGGSTESVAIGKVVFDYLLNPGSSFVYGDATDPESLSVLGVQFNKSDKEDLYVASINGKNIDASSLYIADVNFDGYKDLCIGTISEGEARETYLSIAIFDMHNNNKLLELNDKGNFDYDFDIENDYLIIEEMPHVSKGNRRSVSRVGRFVNNSDKPNHLEWESNSYKLTGLSLSPNIVCVEDQSLVNTYKDTSGADVYVLNTVNTFKLVVTLAYQGDYSTNTKQKGDCITFETSEDFVTTFVEEQNNGTFIYNLSFKREGKYNFKASVEKFDVVTQIEVNNTLYDQLKVA